MSSLILRTATRFMLPLLLLFSVFLLFRGHNEPGGGFAGGLVAASAFALFSLAFDVPQTRQMLQIDPRSLIGTGLLVAIASGIVSSVLGKPFLAHRDLWVTVWLPGFGTLHLGTPLLFDLGVYLVVLGVALTIILSLAEEQE